MQRVCQCPVIRFGWSPRAPRLAWKGAAGAQTRRQADNYRAAHPVTAQWQPSDSPVAAQWQPSGISCTQFSAVHCWCRRCARHCTTPLAGPSRNPLSSKLLPAVLSVLGDLPAPRHCLSCAATPYTASLPPNLHQDWLTAGLTGRTRWPDKS